MNIFSLGSQNVDDSTISSTNEEQSSSDSESWKQSESTEKTPEDDSSSMMNFPLDTREGRSLPNVLKRISNIVALKSNVRSFFTYYMKNVNYSNQLYYQLCLEFTFVQRFPIKKLLDAR